MYSEKQTVYDKIDQQKENEAEKQKAYEEAVKTCFKAVADSEEGKCVLQLLKNLSLWDSEQNNVEQQALAYERGRRDGWLLIRQFIPAEVLAEIEILNKHNIVIAQK